MVTKQIPGKFEHFDLLELRPEEKRMLEADPQGLQKVRLLIEGSHCATLVYNGIILCMFGFYELWPGVIEVWVYPSIYTAENPIPFLKACRRYVNGIVKDLKPHRLQSNSISNELHQRWMTFCGFTKTGIMHKYTADQVDYDMWELIPHE